MRLNTSGLTCCHGVALSLVTVMKSAPRKTEVTPSTFNSCAASGEGCGGCSVERGERYSKNGDGKFSGSIR